MTSLRQPNRLDAGPPHLANQQKTQIDCDMEVT
jgi:hypothetical protein